MPPEAVHDAARPLNANPFNGPSLMTHAIWLLGLLSSALFTGLVVYLADLDPGIVRLQLTFSAEAFNAVIGRWSAEDLARYRAHLPVDFALLLAYGAFGYFWADSRLASTLTGRATRWLLRWSLPTAALCDAGENLLHLWLLATDRSGIDALVALSGSLSTVKLVLIAAFGVVAGRAFLERFTRRAT